MKHIEIFDPGFFDVYALTVDAKRGLVVTVNSTGDVDLLRFTEPHAEPVDIGQERITGTLCDIAWVGDGNAVIVVGECGAHVLGLNGELLFSQTICDLESVAVVDENCVLVAGNDERIRLLNWKEGRELDQQTVGERNTSILRVPSSGPAKFVVTACYQGGCELLWFVVDDNRLHRETGPKIEWNADHVSAAITDPSGYYLAAGAHHFEIFDLSTGIRISGVHHQGRSSLWRRLFWVSPFLVEKFWTQAAFFNGAFACAGTEKFVVLLEAETGRILERLDMTSPATALASDGSCLAAYCKNGSMHLWIV